MTDKDIDLTDIQCFGYTVPKSESWFELLKIVQSSGWKSIDLKQFESSLNKNTIQSYPSLCTIKFKNIANDFSYVVAFDNFRKKWTFRVEDSPENAVDETEKKDFFKSETFKKTTTKADDLISRAVGLAKNMLLQKIEEGAFIGLDEIKFEAVLNFAEQPDLRSNLRLGKSI